MNIAKIQPYNYYSLALNKINFQGGYKDLKQETEKIIFDNTLDMHAAFYKMPNFQDKFVCIEGKKYKLTIFDDGFYVLKGLDDEVNATMKTTEQKYKTKDCSDKFYYDNKGAIEISLLFSKGKGAGSFLIKEAVNDSMQKGYEGRVVLSAETINKAIGSPVPFYYKMGFKAYDPVIQNCIEKKMKDYDKTKTYIQEEEIPMYLAPERIKDYLD